MNHIDVDATEARLVRKLVDSGGGGQMIEHLTQTILNCMTDAPNPEAGARLAAYRVTDELRRAMLNDLWPAAKSAASLYDVDLDWLSEHDEYEFVQNFLHSADTTVRAAWDAVLDDGEEDV